MSAGPGCRVHRSALASSRSRVVRRRSVRRVRRHRRHRAREHSCTRPGGFVLGVCRFRLDSAPGCAACAVHGRRACPRPTYGLTTPDPLAPRAPGTPLHPDRRDPGHPPTGGPMPHGSCTPVPSRTRAAFTLIEVLVVIAVIALLIAIL